MARAKASIGTANHAVIMNLAPTKPSKWGDKHVGPTPRELLCAALGACTAVALRTNAERKQ